MKLSTVVLLGFVSLAVVYAQTDLATVTGVVTDAAQAVVPGVIVTIRNTDTNIVHTTTTNQEGYFAIPELSPGPYELTAARADFSTYRQTKVILETGHASIGESVRPNRILSGKEITGVGRRGVDYPLYDPQAFVAVPGCASRTKCSPDQYGFMPFAPGNSGRNILDGPELNYINTSLLRDWYVAERRSIQFRFEAFNDLNHPNFGLPDHFFNESAAGIISTVRASGRGGARLLQLALKYNF